MKISFYIPQPSLQPFIINIMIGEFKIPKNEAPPMAIFPAAPQQCIYFYPRDPVKTCKHGDSVFTELPSSIVVAAQINRINISLGNDHLVICVSFRPGMLNKLLQTPIVYIKDNSYATEDFLGSEIRLINEQLSATTSHAKMIALIEAFFVAKFKQQSHQLQPFDYAVTTMLRNDGLISIDKAAALSCLSNRQFERYFHERIGFSPKLFNRIIRFSKAYRLKESNPSISWTNIAYETGYYDQMHLIKDFKEFAGVTPTLLSEELNNTPFKLQKDIQL